ncbi:hypothetical protein BDV93DRAFT_527094 [Ceratobasidium sp. AG-I]|nr:hypothetical protein BDV93DRAFT_527094 [Ceratobasidium sp. AG-I]
MSFSLPTEVLLVICEQTAGGEREFVTGKLRRGCPRMEIFGPVLLDLKAFSSASRRFREVAVPLLFRSVCIRTREQVVALVRSRFLRHVRHVHFPAINILTCRRPLGTHIEKLVRQAHSLKFASSEPAFYTDVRRHLSGLLGSVENLQALEVYCGEANLPHVDSTAVLADFVEILPRTLETLSVTLPGGRPSFAGIEALCARISSEGGGESSIANLKNLYLSMQLPLQVALAPAELALPLARRLQKLDLVAIAAPNRSVHTGMMIWELGGIAAGHSSGWGMSGGELKVWKVTRLEGEDGPSVRVSEIHSLGK